MPKKSISQGLNLVQFQRMVREYYSPWYEVNDKAHDINHADSVCKMALILCEKMQYNTRDEKMNIILASYIHDIFSSNDRKNHAQKASDYILRWYQHDDPFLHDLSAERLYIISQAVLEHRASYKEERTHKLSKIIAMADRGIPNLVNTVRRSMKFNSNDSIEVLKHLREKFGTGGYCSYPEEYLSIFKDELVQFIYQVDNLTISNIESISFKKK